MSLQLQGDGEIFLGLCQVSTHRLNLGEKSIIPPGGSDLDPAHQPRPGKVRVVHLTDGQGRNFFQKLHIVWELLEEPLQATVGFLVFVAPAEFLVGFVSLVGVLFKDVHNFHFYLEVDQFVNLIRKPVGVGWPVRNLFVAGERDQIDI